MTVRRSGRLGSVMTFARLLRMLRVDSHMSLADLATELHYTRGHVHNVETGKRPPSRDFAAAADAVLRADGLLLRQWEIEEAERQEEARLASALAASVAGSRDLAEMAGLEVDDLGADVADLAVEYLASPPGPMLEQAHRVRKEVVDRLREHHHRPHERADLYLAAGRLSGVLAYAALDLGKADAAMEHTRAAWRCAEFAGDNELRAWVRGTQSLIARFQSNYGTALGFIRDGLQYVGDLHGTGEARLLCGEAQCLANLRDSAGANASLNAAEDARARIQRPDSLEGLFGFSLAKQRYYAGSSLIWLDGGPDAERAAREASAAIEMWQDMPAAERSLDDEHLAHIYLATARVQLGEVEGAVEAIRPILDLPEEMRISWIIKRLGRVASMLSQPRYAHSQTAQDAVEAIRDLAA